MPRRRAYATTSSTLVQGYFNLPAELGAGEIDACFLLSMPLEATSLQCDQLWKEPLSFVTAPSSELAARNELSILDLAGQVLLLAKHDCANRMVLQQELTKARVEPQAVLEMNSIEAVAVTGFQPWGRP